MASITINIPDADVDRALAAFCSARGYTGPDTRADKAAFARAEIAAWIKQIIVHRESQIAAQAAKAAAASSADGIAIT